MNIIKNKIYICVVLLIITACSKKDEFEGERVDVRLGAVLEEYQKQLVEAPNGWIAYLFPAGGGGYTFKFDFTAQNRVTMSATVEETYANTPKESSYRLRATQVPSLYFDTYNYIHQLADPDPLKSGGSVGEGHLSDFEFSILSASADTLRLKGNLNGSELVLIKATATQKDNFTARAYAQLNAIAQTKVFPYYYNEITIGGSSYNLTFNADKNTLSFYGTDGTTFSTTYAATEDGVVLQEPFVAGNVLLHTLKGLNVNTATHTIRATAGELSLQTTNKATPIAIDLAAAQRMYIEPYQYVSLDAFTVNGVEDGFHMSDISGYAAVTFYPRRYVDGYDAFFVYWNQAANYVGPAVKTSLSSDGKILFHSLAGYGNNGNLDLLTDDDSAKIQEFTSQVLSPEGYYVYQTGTQSYDLVSVSDSKIWIRFN
ncbi:DUF4302 domain-containing protein [Sphingobacterium sp. LRF_L2]|uniref:DUF4302 domain-containing protein n=1 Tax=Sphingobacterium sp. LRF_L2 TaxID=3369421 RepID=UPI003F6301F1